MKLNTFKLTLITIISAILAYLFFTMSDRLAYGQEETTLINGVTFRIVKESEYKRRLREGDRVYIINKKGEKTEVQLIKDNTDIKNTKWVLVDKKTQEPVKK